jgi:PAS domain S-box-containing protein
MQTVQPVEGDLVRLFDLSPDLFCVAGFDGYLKRVNPAFERTLGYTKRELLARPFMDFIHPDDLESSLAALADLAAGNGIAGFENRLLCADGSVRSVEWNTNTRPEEGFVYGVGQDVTDRREAGAELNALRRIAMLVVEGVQPQELFAVVAEEVSRVVDVAAVSVVRYETDGTATECANFNREGRLFPVGVRWSIEGTNILRLVRDSSQAARIDDYSQADGQMAEIVRRAGIRSTVGVPIVVAGRVWGTMVGSTTEAHPLPEGTESRLADFSELLATAIENAESREALQRLADEQAALRRVATQVARRVRPAEIFSAVSDEVGLLFGSNIAGVIRFEDKGPSIVFVGVAKSVVEAIPIGTRWDLDDALASAEVYRTGRPARIDTRDWSSVGGRVADAGRRLGVVSTVASPIVVEGRLWGAMTVSANEPLPLDAEERLERFTDLLATGLANAESREALAQLADEQAALRRVATLVAEGVRPAGIFSAVSEELGRLFGTDMAAVGRFDLDGRAIDLAGLGQTHERWELDDFLASAEVFRTGRSARADEGSWATAGGPTAARLRRLGVVSTVASPIVVEGRLWGTMLVSSKDGPLPLDTEERLAKFTELVATAIANAESRSELAASRRRIVATSDETRRRIERNLHDGTQQRLVSLGLALRAAEAHLPSDSNDVRSELSHIATGLGDAVEELREISRGIHPAILSEGGLGPALRALARRSAIPVELDVKTDTRLPEPIEVAAYFVASEAVANATKHAEASRIHVAVAPRNGTLQLSVRDDGVGGADSGHGSGLVGLQDRVEALGGTIRIHSPPGGGTSLVATVPLELEPAGIGTGREPG